MTNEIKKKCPNCDLGTLEKLTEQELEKERQKLGDELIGIYYGCDECDCIVAEEEIDKFKDIGYNI